LPPTPLLTAAAGDDSEKAHRQRLEQLCRLKTEDIVNLAHRHASDRQPQRLLERDVRCNAVHVASALTLQGYTVREAAQLLQVRPRTLRDWQADWRNDLLQVRALGRPARLASVHQRNEVIHLLDELGPATGLPTLRDCFPDLARAELEDILCRYRRVWRKLNLHTLHRLRWTCPGRVLAIDFSQAPQPIDGLYPYLFAVRDLSSGYQLLWLPVLDLSAATAVHALTWLFVRHDAPLVLKMDNGSAFIAEALQQLLTSWDVIPLFSPPYFPRYNGTAEAGIGSLKTRTEAQAAVQGHPGYWTCQDTATAQDQANATSRPRGEPGPTADELWRDRQPITAHERACFQDALEHHRNTLTQDQHQAGEGPLDPREQRSLQRQAISRALGELGYLLFSRRRFPVPIRGANVTNI
jgi:transposase InsO family protein